MPTNRAFPTVLVLLAMAAGGCSSGSSSLTDTPDPAQLRIINLVSDAPALRTLIEGSLYATLSYTQSTQLTAVSPKGYRFAVEYLPPDASDGVTLIGKTRVRLRSRAETTLVMTGTVDSPDLLVLENAADPAIEPGNTELRLLNASSMTGSLDLYVSSDPGSTSLTGITPISLSFEEYSDPLTMESGSRRLLITRGGSSEIVYDSGALNLVSGARALIAVVDYFGPGGSIRAIRIGADGSSALTNEMLPSTVRAANMISDPVDVDLMVDGSAVAQGLAFGDLSTDTEATPTPHAFTVTRAADPLTELFSVQHTMIPGERRTLLVAGSAVNGTVVGRLVLDYDRPIATAAQVRVIHAAPNSGTLDAYLLTSDETLDDAQPIVTNLVLLASSTTLHEGAEYDIVVTQAGDKTELLGPQHVTIENGGVYTIIIRDADGGAAPGSLVLADDFVQ